MAFSNTVTETIPYANGLIMERGTWNGASVTTGTITADSTGDQVITDIIAWGFANDADNAVLPAKDVAPNAIKITFTSNDTGDYYIIGKAK